jgi:hypothetical protein
VHWDSRCAFCKARRLSFSGNYRSIGRVAAVRLTVTDLSATALGLQNNANDIQKGQMAGCDEYKLQTVIHRRISISA